MCAAKRKAQFSSSSASYTHAPSHVVASSVNDSSWHAFRHLIWTLAPRRKQPVPTENSETQVAWEPGSWEEGRFQLPDNVRVVALVSYAARSRSSILDCYLQSNLAFNGGLLDQVVFVPETGQERDMDWLHALVHSTPGYYVLGKPKLDTDGDATSVPVAGAYDTQVSEEGMGTGPFARAWNLALSVSQRQVSFPESQTRDLPPFGPKPPSDLSVQTIYIFIHGETVFLAHNTISRLLKTHFKYQSYAFIHANTVNQPVMSWIHHHLGVVRPYRPEFEPPMRMKHNRTAVKHLTKDKPGKNQSWRASELPLWRDSHRAKNSADDLQFPDNTPTEQPLDLSPTESPNLFGIPINFHSPFRGHRWLPYHPHEHHPLPQSQPDALTPDPNPDSGLESESISTPITQAMMSLQRPGKWPWTLSALHLYSFLEHLECSFPTPSTSAPTTSSASEPSEEAAAGNHRLNCTHSGSLDRYNMGRWEYQTEQYGLSVFAVSARTVGAIGALPAGVSEAELLARSGRGALIDGGSMAARFVGSAAEDGVGEARGLESTDLLRRFASVSRELGGCGGDDGVL